VLRVEVGTPMGRVKDILAQFVERANAVPKTKEMMSDWNCTIQFDIEGDAPLYLCFENGAVSLHDGMHQSPKVVLKANEDDLYKILSGELNATKAYFTRQLQISGPLSDAMKFGQIGEAVRQG